MGKVHLMLYNHGANKLPTSRVLFIFTVLTLCFRSSVAFQHFDKSQRILELRQETCLLFLARIKGSMQ